MSTSATWSQAKPEVPVTAPSCLAFALLVSKTFQDLLSGETTQQIKFNYVAVLVQERLLDEL